MYRVMYRNKTLFETNQYDVAVLYVINDLIKGHNDDYPDFFYYDYSIIRSFGVSSLDPRTSSIS
jgi:hypothetical protein